MRDFFVQTLNGLTFAGLLFLLGSGFTLIFGLMRIVNMAHGSTYLLGGFIGYSVIHASGNFVLGLAAGALSMVLFGFILERGLLIRIRGLPMPELLLTMGISFIVGDLAIAIWGGDPLSIKMPGALEASTTLAGVVYPNKRVFTLAVGVLVALSLYYLLSRTRTGAIIRAGVDNREMVSALGINVNRLFTLVFILGAFLAGLAGVLGGSFLTLYPGGDSDILTLAVVVVIVGGMGTLQGALAGSLLVGLLTTYGNAYFPQLAYFSLFAPMVVILLWRPQGLFGVTTA